MARIDVPEGEGLESTRMWMLAPHMGAGVSALGTAAYVQSSLPIRERECARMRIAQLNQCLVCLNTRAATAMEQGLTDELYKAVSDYRTDDRFTPREKLAIEFAEWFAVDHTAIDDAFFVRLKQLFTDSEILELSITVGFCVGIGRAFHVLDVARDFDVLWSREPPKVGASA